MSYEEYTAIFTASFIRWLILFAVVAAIEVVIYIKLRSWKTTKWLLITSIGLPILGMMSHTGQPYNLDGSTEVYQGFEFAFGVYFVSLIILWTIYTIYRSNHIDRYNAYFKGELDKLPPPSDEVLLKIKRDKLGGRKLGYGMDRIGSKYERGDLTDIWEKKTLRAIKSEDPFRWITYK